MGHDQSFALKATGWSFHPPLGSRVRPSLPPHLDMLCQPVSRRLCRTNLKQNVGDGTDAGTSNRSPVLIPSTVRLLFGNKRTAYDVSKRSWQKIISPFRVLARRRRDELPSCTAASRTVSSVAFNQEREGALLLELVGL